MINRKDHAHLWGPLSTRGLYNALGNMHRIVQDRAAEQGQHATDAYLVAHQQLRHRAANALDPRLDLLPFHAMCAAHRVQLMTHTERV